MTEDFERALDKFWNFAYEWGWERKAHLGLRESAKAAEDEVRKEIANYQSNLIDILSKQESALKRIANLPDVAIAGAWENQEEMKCIAQQTIDDIQRLRSSPK